MSHKNPSILLNIIQTYGVLVHFVAVPHRDSDAFMGEVSKAFSFEDLQD